MAILSKSLLPAWPVVARQGFCLTTGRTNGAKCRSFFAQILSYMAAGLKHPSRPHGGPICFLLDGAPQSVEITDPSRTVLQWLREDVGATGTKEGCAEGDCGACTITLAELADQRLRFRAINACIQFLPTLDGKAVYTVAGLAEGPSADLHPVQQAMVDTHASQCGFCTPGIVMSLFALYKSTPAPDRQAINDALAGNLCRCTGYRPIVAAAEQMTTIGQAIDPAAHTIANAPAGAGGETLRSAEVALADELRSMQRRVALEIQSDRGRFVAPTSVGEASDVLVAHPGTRILAGGTDIGLWVTKQHKTLGDIVYLGNVAELKRITVTSDFIEIGAAASLTDAFAALEPHYPLLRELFRRFASPPIRNAGTLAGNIANGSPIGDSMPVLIALGTRIALLGGNTRREMPLDALYLGYQKTGLRPGEFIERVLVPLPRAGVLVGAYKVSKRFDQDISAVCSGYALTLTEGRIESACIAYGGMAETPKRAPECEAALRGRVWNEATCNQAMRALERDFTPISDMRASRWYRLQVARNLLRRFYLETRGSAVHPPLRLYDFPGSSQ